MCTSVFVKRKEGFFLERMLEMEIESTREQMIQKALEVGFNNSVTLGISCKLDQLLNQLEKRRKARMFYEGNVCPCSREWVGKD